MKYLAALSKWAFFKADDPRLMIEISLAVASGISSILEVKKMK